VANSKTIQQLTSILADEENKVVALSGPWGSGKTHLWKEINAASGDDQISGAIYASLFGVSDIRDLKLRLSEQCISDESNPILEASFKKFAMFKDAIIKAVPKLGVAEDLIAIAAPSLIKGKLIVIDDIERKSSTLAIDAILGFIDEGIHIHDARFLVIMNAEKLGDLEKWEELREKVVDHEVSITITPKEAFDIANTIHECIPEVKDLVRKSLEICGVVNIRIAHKVIRSVNIILGDHIPISAKVAERMIPPLVILSATHFKGINEGPDIDFILNPPRSRPRLDPGKAALNIGHPEDEKHKRWRAMLSMLGMDSAGEFESLVVAFLQSGMFERDRLDQIIDLYRNDEGAQKFSEDLRGFYHDLRWDITREDTDLVEDAKKLIERIKFASAGEATGLADTVKDLPGCRYLSDKLISEWLSHNGSSLSRDPYGIFSPYGGLHPDIVARARKNSAEEDERYTPLHVCTKIRYERGWSQRDEDVLSRLSADDFQEYFESCSSKDLEFVLLQMFEMYRHRSQAYQGFAFAIDNFAEACAQIARGQDRKLKRIIVEMMDDSGMPR